ncbi:MFS transporter [Clostridium tertium]|uniref:MFS transporter n=1 Tax=Clostridium tertium TaxID=1559 RepID=UPI0024B348FE|nr:glycoside-pentoside-hexuronide (GPH):cation symporter [Clostridium tertium]MDI9215664.1 glycoside-pentoside-hexuronide (GPH):cation symporter [Clostridium tertium]
MGEKRYLKWYNKVGYGSGDIAGNVVFAFVSSFIMIYLTNSIGLNAGIIGSLIAVSKLFDGITDLFFGVMIDKTNSKIGKARPWMLGAFVGCAITLVALFAIPVELGEFSKYAWFFIAYVLLHAVFYTANNIAYSTLTALITRNSKERVQMGSIRFIFAFATSLLIQTITVSAVEVFGGGATGWRTIAIIYAIIGLIVNTISVFSVKELPAEELYDTTLQTGEKKEEHYSFIEIVKLLVSNKYYLIILVVDVLRQIYSAMINMGIYFMTYVLGSEKLFGVFSWAINIPIIIGLSITPMIVAKMKGQYKVNAAGYVIAAIGRMFVVVVGYIGNLPLMLVFTGLAAFGMSAFQGGLNALIVQCSEYTYLKTHKRIDGSMYSCTSFGLKIGGGIGTAIAGWLLAYSGFDASLATQSQACIDMLYIMYLWIPMFINIIIAILLMGLDVEKANDRLRAKIEA